MRMERVSRQNIRFGIFVYLGSRLHISVVIITRLYIISFYLLLIRDETIKLKKEPPHSLRWIFQNNHFRSIKFVLANSRS